MPMPAFPRSSHAKPVYPCSRSMPVHNAAVAGMLHQRLLTNPASAANTAIGRPL